MSNLYFLEFISYNITANTLTDKISSVVMMPWCLIIIRGCRRSCCGRCRWRPLPPAGCACAAPWARPAAPAAPRAGTAAPAARSWRPRRPRRTSRTRGSVGEKVAGFDFEKWDIHHRAQLNCRIQVWRILFLLLLLTSSASSHQLAYSILATWEL